MDASDMGSLATLDALLQESSVSGAARRLGLSTPAVSHALAKLRERFDDPLLVRAGRGMVLTPRAEQLRPRVHAAVMRAAEIFEDQRDFDPARTERTFTLSMTDYVLTVFGDLFDVMLRERAPHIDLHVLINTPDDPERLRRGESDLTIGIYGDLPPELKMRPVITDRFVCVVRQDHPVLDERLSLATYVALDHVLIAPRGDPRGYVDRMLEARGMTRRIARCVPYFRIALEMVVRSDAILTVSERLALQLADELGLAILEPPLPLEPFALSMLWHPRFDADVGHAWLRDQLVEATASRDGVAHPGARRVLEEGRH